MAVDHEGFTNLDSGAFTNGKKSLCLCDGEAERLLAENVLTGFGGFDGPGT